MLCLVVAAGSSSLGVPIMVGVGVELVVSGGAPGSSSSRGALRPLVPELWGQPDNPERRARYSQLLHRPCGFPHSVAWSAEGSNGDVRSRSFGLLAVVRHLTRPFACLARLASLLAAVLTLWIITGLARSTLGATRIQPLYLSWRGADRADRRRAAARRDDHAADERDSDAIVILCAFTSLTVMHTGALGFEDDLQDGDSPAGALELREGVRATELSAQSGKAPPVYAGLYLHAVRSIGSSPADTRLRSWRLNRPHAPRRTRFCWRWRPPVCARWGGPDCRARTRSHDHVAEPRHAIAAGGVRATEAAPPAAR